MSGDLVFKILVVDDDDSIRRLWRSILEMDDTSRHMEEASNTVEAMKKMETSVFNIVISDVYMPPGPNGYALLSHIRAHHPFTKVIMMTNNPQYDGAVEAMKKGAEAYLPKPFTLEESLSIVEEIESQLRADHTQMVKLLDTQHANPLSMLVKTRNPKMHRLLERLPQLADSNEPLLLSGETGVGKSSVAKLLHKRSRRTNKPFIVVNCAGVAEELIESELFGHVKGAFTGAHKDKTGFFQQADGGTILLDEINSTSLKFQRTLLQVLQDGIICRVGDPRVIPVNVRILCATNKDLDTEIRAGRFREDLFYRISTFTVDIPPLRERPEDIEDLACYFLNQKQSEESGNVVAERFSMEYLELLKAYPWPGNIRELRSAVIYSAQLCQGRIIDPSYAKESIRKHAENLIEPPAPGPGGYPPPVIDPMPAPRPVWPPRPHDDTGIHPSIWPAGMTLEDLVDTSLGYTEAIKRANALVREAYLRGVVRSFSSYGKAAAHAKQQRSNFRRLIRENDIDEPLKGQDDLAEA